MKPKKSSKTSPESVVLYPEQGHCYLVDFNPPRKSKPGKVRPVVVLQADDVTRQGAPGLVVVPLTSQLKADNILRVRLEPTVKLKITQASDVLLDQVHTIDKSLFLEDLGSLSAEKFQKIQQGVLFLLGY